MDATTEVILRCAQRKRSSLDAMSDGAFQELCEAVSANLDDFADAPDERALLELGRGLAKAAPSPDDELLSEDDFQRTRRQRLDAVSMACERAIAIDPNCVDAKHVSVLVADKNPSDSLDLFLDLLHETGDLEAVEGVDLYETDITSRPRLRLMATCARLAMDTAHFRLAGTMCERMLDLSGSDALGARYTLALVLARLELESELNALDTRFERQGNAWMHLARALLMFKLDRMPAAKRALRGFDTLCEGGAYALLRPVYVDTYLPDRPRFKPGSYEEALFATFEAEPVVVDTPDFVHWANSIESFSASAQSFARKRGFDW